MDGIVDEIVWHLLLYLNEVSKFFTQKNFSLLIGCILTVMCFLLICICRIFNLSDKYTTAHENSINDLVNGFVNTLNPFPADTPDNVLKNIHYWLQYGDAGYAMVKLLLERHGQEYMNVPFGKHQYTAFLAAVSNEAVRVVEYMIQNGADVTKTTKGGHSPIYLAIHRAVTNSKSPTDNERYERLLCILYNAGCDVTKASCQGKAPIHVATLKGNYYFVKWLLSKGADADKHSRSNCRSLRPIDIALRLQTRDLRYRKITNLFKQYQTNL